MQEDINLERRSYPTDCEKNEKADYLDVFGDQLYYVLHSTIKDLKGRILFCGPFVSERPHRYIPIVRLARFLAENGYDVLRFDYRGCGESTGEFENFGFHAWKTDALECLSMLQRQGIGGPIILYGLGMGALIAERVFHEGFGDALLLNLPPKAGREMLFEQLRLRLANDFVLKPPKRMTREDYVAELENGNTVEVEGFLWTPKLWAEASEYILSETWDKEGNIKGNTKPARIYELDTYSAHMFGGVGPNPLRRSGGRRQMRLVNPDLTSMFSEVCSIIDEWVQHIEQHS